MNFSRQDGEACQVINVQSSQWNSNECGKFTINVGVDFASVAKLLPGRGPMPTSPKEYLCLLRIRVGNLMPARRDHWWTVTPDTDIEEVCRELGDAWTACISPWLARFRTVASLTAEPDQGVILNSFARPAASILIGDRGTAARLIKREIEELWARPPDEFQEKWLAEFRKWAEEQGLDIGDDSVDEGTKEEG